MNTQSNSMSLQVPVVLAQQGANNQAYENGKVVGQIFGYIFVGVIVLWVLKKVFGGR